MSSAPISLRLVVQADSLSADLGNVFSALDTSLQTAGQRISDTLSTSISGSLSTSLDSVVRKIDSSIQYMGQRFSSMFESMGIQFAAALNIENIMSRMNAATTNIASNINAATHQAAAPVALAPSEANAINEYARFNFNSINKMLRGDEVSFPDQTRSRIEKLSSAVEKLPDFSGETYRGLQFRSAEMDKYGSLIEKLAVGGTFSDPAFFSTSKSQELMEKYSSVMEGGKSIQMTVRGQSGKDIEKFSDMPESEVLYKPNTPFKVESMATEGNITRVVLSEIAAAVAGQAKGGGGGSKPIDSAELESLIGGLSTVMTKEVHGASGILRSMETLTGIDPDTGSLLRGTVNFNKNNEATRVTITTRAPKIEDAESSISPEDQLAMLLRGRKIEGDVSAGAESNLTENSELLARQQQIMDNALQERMGRELQAAYDKSALDGQTAIMEAAQQTNERLAEQFELYGKLKQEAAPGVSGTDEMGHISGLLDQRSSEVSAAQNAADIQAAQIRQREQFESEANAYVERAFSHAANFADIDRQGNGAGEMESISASIQQRASERQSTAIMAQQAEQRKQLEKQYGSKLSADAPGGGDGGVFFSSFASGASGAWEWITKLRGATMEWTIAWYGVKSAAETVYSLFERPFAAVEKATEDSRKFELAISGITGGMSRAREVDDDLVRELDKIPLTLEQTREVTEQMAKNGMFASLFATGSPDQAAIKASEYAQTVAQLSALNPQTGVDKIIATMQQSITGQVNTRQFRINLGIDPDEMARLSGTTTKVMNQDPAMFMDALKQYLSVYGQGMASGSGDLVGVAWEKLKDDPGVALQKIGDSGVYDQIASRFKTLVSSILGYLNSPQFAGRAEEIGSQMGGFFDSVGESALKFLQEVSGASDLAGTPDAIASQVERIVTSATNLAKDLPGIASSLGQSINGLIELFQGAAEKARIIWNAPSIAASTALAVGGATNFGSVGAWESRGSRFSVSESDRIPGFDPKASSPGTLNPTAFIPPDVIDTAKSTNVIEGSYSAAKKSAMELIDRMSTFDDGAEKLGVAFKVAASTMNQVAGTSKDSTGDIFSNIIRFRNNSIDQIEDGVAKLQEQSKTETDPGKLSIINKYIDSFQAASDNLQSGLMPALQSTADGLVKNVGRFGVEVSQSIKGGGDAYAATILQEFADGKTQIQTQAANLLSKYRVSGDVGFESISLPRRQGFVDELAKYRESEAKSLGAGGVSVAQFNASSGMSASDFAAMSAGQGGLPKTDSLMSQISGRTSITDENITTYEQALRQSEADYTAAQLALAKDSNDEAAQGAFVKAKAAIVEYELKLTEAKQANNEFFQSMVQFGNQVQGALGKSVGDGLYDIITKAKDAKNVFRDLAQSILHDFTGDIGKTMMSSIFGAGNGQSGAGNGIGGLIGAIMGGGAASGSGSGAGGGLPAGGLVGLLAKGIGGLFAPSSSQTLLGINPGDSGHDEPEWGSPSASGGPAGGISTDSSGNPNLLQAIQGFGGALMGGLGAAFAAMGGGGSKGSTPTDQPGQNATTTSGAADGGIFEGGLRFLASGGVVKGGPGQFALIGEGGPGADEGIVPLHGGSIPIGFNSSGMHAVLPGGRSIPAHAFASGGIIPGGIATAPGPRWSSGPATMGGTQPASGSSDTHVTIYTVANQAEAMAHGYSQMKGHILHDVYNSARPGGPLRRSLSKPN